MRPLAIDLYCGLGGWTEGLLAEGYDVVGFDIERHDYGTGGYPAQLVLQDALTLHGSQFKDAALIVASPPCQEFSYMAMPWSKAKAKERDLLEGRDDPKRLTALFDACFRIQREAIEAAGHFIPLVVENVRGAQKWVGRSRWNYGSFHLWGDVPALMPMTKQRGMKGSVGTINGSGKVREQSSWDRGQKVPGFRFDGSGKSFQTASVEGTKTVGHVNIRDGHSHTRHLTNQRESDGLKCPGNKLSENGFTIPIARQIDQSLKPDSFELNDDDRRQHLSFSRKAASAAIAKIPEPLARYIAKVYYPLHETEHSQARRQVQPMDDHP